MDYRVAVDTTGQAAQAIMGAAGASGIPFAAILDGGGVVRHCGHPMEPRFAQVLDVVCSGAGGGAGGGAAAAGTSGGAGAAAAAPPKQERELPPVTASREELAAMPVGGAAPCPALLLGLALLPAAVAAPPRPTLGGMRCERMLRHEAPPCSQAPSFLSQVRELKRILEERGIPFADLNEKVGRLPSCSCSLLT